MIKSQIGVCRSMIAFMIFQLNWKPRSVNCWETFWNYEYIVGVAVEISWVLPWWPSTWYLYTLSCECIISWDSIASCVSEDTPAASWLPTLLSHVGSQVKTRSNGPWRYRSRSKVITCDTPSHASDHLYQIWKESIRNCRCYRADTIFKAKAKWPWRYRWRSKVIICNTPSHTGDHLC